ncbi:MAG: di-heme oxidoredictase family protein [Alphaproteobacteria bacterium]
MASWFSSRRAERPGLAVTVVAAALACAAASTPVVAADISPELGGETTRPVATHKAFTFPLANLPKDKLRAFFFGNRLFNTNWVQAPGSVKSFDGLGPVYNRVSCSGCHTHDGRGRPPEAAGEPMLSMLVRLSLPGEDRHGGPNPHPAYGDQLNDRAIQGVPAEGRAVIDYEAVPGAYADGEPYVLMKPTYRVEDLGFGPLGEDAMLSPRVAPAMIGVGLLEAVPEAIITAAADPEDADGDGISGRANLVWDETAGGPALGRFGWKANQPSVRQQVAGAAVGDIGLTTPLFPHGNCAATQDACAAAPSGGEPEISASFFDRLVLYSQSLAVPAQRNPGDPAVKRGAALFTQAGCDGCHTPTVRTGEHELAALAHQTIHPFTDLLLHDMGPELADGRPDFLATGSEWRTAPLWGIGLVETVNGHTRFLHDGRARDLAEAILWHGGEGEAPREAFRAMSKEEREALLAFLNSL